MPTMKHINIIIQYNYGRVCKLIITLSDSMPKIRTNVLFYRRVTSKLA